MILSVVIAVLVGSYGLFGFSTGDSAGGRDVEAKVVTAAPCDPPGAMEIVSFTVDGRERQATLDGCGHQPSEPVRITVPTNAGSAANLVVRTASANPGEGDDGRRLGLFLLVLAGIASAGYGLLFYRGPRGTPFPLMGPFTPPDLNRLLAKRSKEPTP